MSTESCSKSLDFPIVLTTDPKWTPKILLSTAFRQPVALVEASGCSSTSGSLNPCHANPGATLASGLYTFIVPAIWLFVSRKNWKILRRKNTTSCAPPRPALNSPLSFDVIYRASYKETFTGHAKHLQEICITFMHWNNIIWTCFRQYKVRYQLLRIRTKSSDGSSCPPTPPPSPRPPDTSTLLVYVILFNTTRVLSIIIFRLITTMSLVSCYGARLQTLRSRVLVPGRMGSKSFLVLR